MSPEEVAVREAAGFVAKVNDIILFPLITLLIAVAFLVFVWGIVQYVLNADNESERAKGKTHMIYGLIGLFIMLSAWSILAIVAGTVGLSDELNCAKNPTASGCESAFEAEINL